MMPQVSFCIFKRTDFSQPPKKEKTYEVLNSGPNFRMLFRHAVGSKAQFFPHMQIDPFTGSFHLFQSDHRTSILAFLLIIGL